MRDKKFETRTLEELIVPEDIKNYEVKEYYWIVGVIFKSVLKRYFFESPKDMMLNKGDKVIVDTVRGQEMGEIYLAPTKLHNTKLILPVKPVLKKATQEEINKSEKQIGEAREALKLCKKLVSQLKLEMKLVLSEYTFDKSKLIFYFYTDGRVDFRDLLKELAVAFKIRIELRQIGVRDVARILGDYGICGQELCCRTHINKFESISIKMAKTQGLITNPSKISGCCGKLRCCLAFENEQYKEIMLDFPKLKQEVRTADGIGKVLSINPISRELFIHIENGGNSVYKLDDIKFENEACGGCSKENCNSNPKDEKTE
ncbi:MAG: regulatory iron-sulfur-containing complex subunit RicT [Fusobacteria bacterium]|nr:regulatory iron-sulfur-containing complex subunit RicT [Fusobacteriota bacterium]